MFTFRELTRSPRAAEADHIINALEKHLYSIDSDSLVLFSLKEIEDMVYDRERHNDFRKEYLMVTDKYLADSEDKNRIPIADFKDRKVKTRIVNA